MILRNNLLSHLPALAVEGQLPGTETHLEPSSTFSVCMEERGGVERESAQKEGCVLFSVKMEAKPEANELVIS